MPTGRCGHRGGRRCGAGRPRRSRTQHDARRLEGISAAVDARAQCVADLAAAVLDAAEEQNHVAHDLAAVALHDAQRDGVAVSHQVAIAQHRRDPFAPLGHAEVAVVHVPIHLGQGPVGLDRLGVVDGQLAQQERSVSIGRVGRTMSTVLLGSVRVMQCTATAIWDERYLAYDFGDHPLNPVRLDLTIRLARELGVLDRLDDRRADVSDRDAVAHSARRGLPDRGAARRVTTRTSPATAWARPTIRCSPACTTRPRWSRAGPCRPPRRSGTGVPSTP